VSHYEWRTVLPDSFLNGSAPRLRTFDLDAISFPGLTKLFLSATHLVQLWLHNLHYSGYISLEAMVPYLSTLTNLESLDIAFLFPYPILPRNTNLFIYRLAQSSPLSPVLNSEVPANMWRTSFPALIPLDSTSFICSSSMNPIMACRKSSNSPVAHQVYKHAQLAPLSPTIKSTVQVTLSSRKFVSREFCVGIFRIMENLGLVASSLTQLSVRTTPTLRSVYGRSQSPQPQWLAHPRPDPDPDPHVPTTTKTRPQNAACLCFFRIVYMYCKASGLVALVLITPASVPVI
jgi:hypothetical protein